MLDKVYCVVYFLQTGIEPIIATSEKLDVSKCPKTDFGIIAVDRFNMGIAGFFRL